MAKKKRVYAVARNYEKTGKVLCRYRILSGLTQREVADALKYSSAQFISNFERGLSTPPATKLSRLFKLYNLNREGCLEVIDSIQADERALLLSKVKV